MTCTLKGETRLLIQHLTEAHSCALQLVALSDNPETADYLRAIASNLIILQQQTRTLFPQLLQGADHGVLDSVYPVDASIGNSGVADGQESVLSGQGESTSGDAPSRSDVVGDGTKIAEEAEEHEVRGSGHGQPKVVTTGFVHIVKDPVPTGNPPDEPQFFDGAST